MNIVHLCTSDLRHGAGIAAYRLHHSLRKLGVNSNLIVAQKLSDEKHVVWAKEPSGNSFVNFYRWGHHMTELFLNVTGSQNVYSYLSKDLEKHPLIQAADVIHFHNIHWPFRNFSLNLLEWGLKKPLFWTFHDVWPITGHCFYPLDCDRWKEGCGHCPRLRMFIPLLFDTSAYQWRLKKKLYEKTKMMVITPSTWLRDMAQQSPLLIGQNVECIPNCIDRNIFKPIDQRVARKSFGLNPTAKVLLFVASKLDIPIKGLSYVEEAISKIQWPNQDLVLLTVGRGAVPLSIKNKIKVKELGKISDSKKMARVYSAADLTLSPSKAESFHFVTAESMSCGTPVIGFNTGGIKDLVDHDKNGYLAQPENSDDLAKGISLFLNNSNACYDKAKIETIIKAQKYFSSTVVAKKHLHRYEDHLEK